MKNMNEQLKRFKQIISYNLEEGKLINEALSSHIQKITDKISEDLPLNEYSSAIDSITLLQKVLVGLGFLKKTYGIDGDGVDGDFGNDTKDALTKAIKSKELTTKNIDSFSDLMETNQTKLVNTYTKWETFFDEYKKQGGVPKEKFDECKVKTTLKDKEWVISRKTCVTIDEMAEKLNSVMGDYGIIPKASVLSVMIKEQGKGKYICAPNNNFAGVQTDSGQWGDDLNSLVDAQFCKKDREKYRGFASFNKLETGLSFISNAFEKKGWFTVINDINDEEVDLENIDINSEAEKNAKIWQTNWNLKLSHDEYENFKNYGYNPKIRKTSFTDEKGIYTKTVGSLTPAEKEIHNKHLKTGPYRSPDVIQASWDAMNKYFKLAFNSLKKSNENNISANI